MPVTISLTFDDEWAARLAPVVRAVVKDRERHPLMQSLLTGAGFTSIDELTTVQQAKAELLFHLMTLTMHVEGDEAERTARTSVIEDVESNFPLEV